MKDLFILAVLVIVAYFLLQNFEYPAASATSDNYQWSGDDTLKVMFVKDSAYIVR